MKTLTAAFALSILAGVATANAAPVIRTAPAETTQKAENVGYYGHYYGYSNYYYVPKPRYNFYYNYGYGY